MATIISNRTEKLGTDYSRNFVYIDDSNAGFSFPCDKAGNLIVDNEGAMANYKACLTGKVGDTKVIDKGIVERVYTYFEPMKIKCNCNRVLNIEGDTKCFCGQWYNGFGQELENDWISNPSVYDEEIGDLY